MSCRTADSAALLLGLSLFLAPLPSVPAAGAQTSGSKQEPEGTTTAPRVAVASGLEVSDSGRSSRFMVRADTATDTLTHEFQILKLAQPLLGGWSSVAEKWTKVGGIRAGLTEGIRARAGEPARHEWNIVLLWHSRKYSMLLVAPETDALAAARTLEAILLSFKWGDE